jgi:stearoyl-CoA desaturase (delta-9 desaturase)
MTKSSTPQVENYDWPVITFLALAHMLGAVALGMPTKAGVIAFGVLYFITALGITLGFHRYFTHRSFQAPRWVGRILAIMGTLALQGSILEWVAHHRMHHAGSDTHRDPHNARRGFWYSHIGWLGLIIPEFDSEKALKRFGRDIVSDPFLVWLSKPATFIGIQVALGIALWIVGGFEAMMWGIWLRLVAVYHATWLVNSAAHLWGYKNYPVGDLATNNWWVAILALGEGWHNNHHAFGESAKHGHKWWEFDITWGVIRIMRGLGLATDIRLAATIDKSLNVSATAAPGRPEARAAAAGK